MTQRYEIPMAKAIEFEIKIKGDSGVLKRMSVEASSADEAIERLVESAGAAGASLKKLAANSLVFDGAIRAIGELNGVVNELVSPFNSFETAMRKANTMAGTSGEEYERLTDQIAELSKTIPMAREGLAEGLYQTISNGVPEDNWIGFLEQSSKAAVGGLADLGQTVTVTSTIIKNYGLEWSAAGAIEDKIQTTAKNGVTSFEQLGQALPRVTGSAAQLGVEIDELMAVFATTTGVTGNTAEVSTQLAAVLNSLIKPSSEASAAAAAMGIQFDAASVKACGGFRNFLTELDASVEAYAASSGQLSETIYGQLFGSAEALRLLGSLTGEQKEKFAENIGAMADSAGAIESAFVEMSSTGEANAQTFRNQIQAMTDWAGALMSGIAPSVEFAANAGTMIASIGQLGRGVQSAIATVKTWNVAGMAAAGVQKTVSAATQVWTVAQGALNAVMSMNPLGIAIIAVSALAGAIITAYNKSEAFRRVCDQVWESVKNVAGAVWDHLVTAFEGASKVIQTAWEWVKEFFGIDGEESAEEMAGALGKEEDAAKGLARETEKATAAGLKAKEATDWQRMSYEQLGQAIERQKAKLGQLAGTGSSAAKSEAALLKQMQERYKSLGKKYGLSEGQGGNEFDGKKLISNAQSYAALGNNISYYRKQLEKTSPKEAETMKRLAGIITELEKNREVVSLLQAGYSQSGELKTIGEIESAIEYQRKLRENATAENLGGIDSEIKRLERLKEALEDSGHNDRDPGTINSYRDLEEEIGYYNELLKRTGREEQARVAERLRELNRIKEGWDEALAALEKPADIDSLNSIAELERGISYYEARMKKASASEIAELARQKQALEAKRDAMNRLATIPAIQNETAKLQELDGMKLRVKLEMIGLSEIQAQIRTLQGMLDDTENPLGGEERKSVEGLLATWKNFEKTARKSPVADGIATVGTAFGTLGSAIDGAAGSWMNYFGQILGSVAKLIPAIQAMTMANAMNSEAQTPIVGWLSVGAAAAAVVAAFASLPKFADGGIAYGPTLGIFGEYAGAANNPEVVAPLSRLRELIAPESRGDGYGKVEFEIDGMKLKGLMNKIERRSARR